MSTIKEILMKRDGNSAEEADARIEDAKAIFWDYLDSGDTESAYYICESEFGLEPDYLDEFI